MNLALLYAKCKILGFLTSIPNYFGTLTNRTLFEADGTLKAEGDATYWRDIDFPLIVRTTGPNVPVMTTIQGNLNMPLFTVNDYVQMESQEFVHEWKEASPATWHLHFYTNGTDTADRFVKFEIEYFWSNTGGTLTGSNTVISADLTIPANTPAKTHLIRDIAVFTPTGGKIGGHIKARLKRIAATGTAPTAAGVFCEMVQLHIECDTLGSRQISSK